MILVLRKMTLEDIEQVVALDQMSFSLPWPMHSFQYEVTGNPAARCWVAELEGRVVGMVVAWFIVDEIHVATFAVHSDFRKQGIGEKLLAITLQSAKDEGAISSFLEVRESNIAALALYRKFGFVVDGRRKGYYKNNGEDAILMSLKDLSGG